jgi:hypothetical protein
VVLILLEIGEGDFEYPTLKSIVGVFETGCAIDEGFSNTIVKNCQSTVQSLQ